MVPFRPLLNRYGAGLTYLHALRASWFLIHNYLDPRTYALPLCDDHDLL